MTSRTLVTLAGLTSLFATALCVRVLVGCELHSKSNNCITLAFLKRLAECGHTVEFFRATIDGKKIDLAAANVSAVRLDLLNQNSELVMMDGLFGVRALDESGVPYVDYSASIYIGFGAYQMGEGQNWTSNISLFSLLPRHSKGGHDSKIFYNRAVSFLEPFVASVVAVESLFLQPTLEGMANSSTGCNCDPFGELQSEYRDFVKDLDSKDTIHVASGTFLDRSLASNEIPAMFFEAINKSHKPKVLGMHINLTELTLQLDLLAHSETKVFLLPSGTKKISLHEALCMKTHFMLMPMFAEHSQNAKFALSLGVGTALNIAMLTKDQMLAELIEVSEECEQQQEHEELHRKQGRFLSAKERYAPVKKQKLRIDTDRKIMSMNNASPMFGEQELEVYQASIDSKRKHLLGLQQDDANVENDLQCIASKEARLESGVKKIDRKFGVVSRCSSSNASSAHNLQAGQRRKECKRFECVGPAAKHVRRREPMIGGYADLIGSKFEFARCTPGRRCHLVELDVLNAQEKSGGCTVNMTHNLPEANSCFTGDSSWSEDGYALLGKGTGGGGRRNNVGGGNNRGVGGNNGGGGGNNGRGGGNDGRAGGNNDRGGGNDGRGGGNNGRGEGNDGRGGGNNGRGGGNDGRRGGNDGRAGGNNDRGGGNDGRGGGNDGRAGGDNGGGQPGSGQTGRNDDRGGHTPAPQPGSSRNADSVEDMHTARAPNYFNHYYRRAFKDLYTISDRTKATTDLGYNVPLLLNWGSSCTYVVTAMMLAPISKHVIPMLAKRMQEGRGQDTNQADELARALTEALTSPGTPPKPVSIERFRKALTPDMVDKSVAGILPRNFRTLLSEYGLKLKSEDSVRFLVHIDRAATCPLCGKSISKSGPAAPEPLFYLAVPAGKKYDFPWTDAVGKPHTSFGPNSRPSMEGTTTVPCCKTRIEYGPGKDITQLQYRDKLGTAATSTTASDRPTSDNPRFLFIVFSARDDREARELKVTLRPTDCFHAVRNKVQKKFKQAEGIFNIEGQLTYHLVSYGILDDHNQNHIATRLRNAENTKFFHVDSTDKEQFVAEVHRDEFYAKDLRIAVALYISYGERCNVVPRSHEHLWPEGERHEPGTPLVVARAVETRASRNQRRRRRLHHHRREMSAKTSLELRAEALRVEVSNEGRWPLSDAQHPLPGHPPWAHEFPLPRTPAALGGHGVERSDRGHHDAATATSDPLAAEDEPSRPHPVHHQQQVEGESDQGSPTVSVHKPLDQESQKEHRYQVVAKARGGLSAKASVVTLVAAVFAGISVAALVICACRRHNRRSSEPKRQKPSDGAVEPLVHPEMAPAAPTGTSDRPPARPRTLILGSSGGTESHTADVPAVMSTAHRSHADGPSPVCCTPSAKPATSHGSGRCSRHSSSSSASNVNLHNSHRMPDNCVEGITSSDKASSKTGKRPDLSSDVDANDEGSARVPLKPRKHHQSPVLNGSSKAFRDSTQSIAMCVEDSSSAGCHKRVGDSITHASEMRQERERFFDIVAGGGRKVVADLSRTGDNSDYLTMKPVHRTKRFEPSADGEGVHMALLSNASERPSTPTQHRRKLRTVDRPSQDAKLYDGLLEGDPLSSVTSNGLD